MNYETISVEETHQGEVTEIIMGPPPANVLSAKMMKEIEAQLDIDEKLPAKKLIIFTGQGKHFCFGASVEEHKPEHVNDMLPAFHNLIGRLIDCPIPTLAKVTGMCLGGGFELALACTLIFADETAKFSVPEITLGVFPPPAASLLPFKCADQAASQIILSGEQFPAEKLETLGLINQVAKSGELDEAVLGFFETQFQPKSASSLRFANRAVGLVLSEHYKNSIGKLEKMYLQDLMSTHDAVEGLNAFLEKRKAVWNNT